MPEIKFDDFGLIVSSYEEVGEALRILPKNIFEWKNPEGNNTGYATRAERENGKIVIYQPVAYTAPRIKVGDRWIERESQPLTSDVVELGVKIPKGGEEVCSDLEKTIFNYQGKVFEVVRKGISDYDERFGEIPEHNFPCYSVEEGNYGG